MGEAHRAGPNVRDPSGNTPILWDPYVFLLLGTPRVQPRHHRERKRNATIGRGHCSPHCPALSLLFRLPDVVPHLLAVLVVQLGIPQADVANMAADAMVQTRLLVNNPVEVTEPDAVRLYHEIGGWA